MSNIMPVGPKSAHLVCPSCHASVSTKVTYVNTTKTHLIALALCVFLCWPCVCVPYCINTCKSVNHYCPCCNAFLGSYGG